MRIVYLHQYFNTPAMSGATRSYEFARRWVMAGHEVHMITTRRDVEGRDKEWIVTDEQGIRVHWLPLRYSNSLSYQSRLRVFVEYALKAGPRAVSVKPDLVFATSTPLTVALPAVYVKWRLGIPMVFEVRDLWPELPIAMGAIRNPVAKWVAKKLEWFAYHNAANVVALSPGMKEGVVGAGYPPEKVAVIPNACDLDRFNVGPEQRIAVRVKHPQVAQRPFVLYAGTLGRINGVTYLAELAAEVHRIDPEVAFVIIGSGAEFDLVERRAKALGVLDVNFFMLGRRSKEEIAAWFSAAAMGASVVIDMEELWVNSANKFFDTLASGTPVMINYGGWQADLIKERRLGLVLSPQVSHPEAERLVKFLRNSPQMAHSANAARELAAERFSRDRLSDELLTFLVGTHNKFRSLNSGGYQDGRQ